jgi:hypothetical protein
MAGLTDTFNVTLLRPSVLGSVPATRKGTSYQFLFSFVIKLRRAQRLVVKSFAFSSYFHSLLKDNSFAFSIVIFIAF